MSPIERLLERVDETKNRYNEREQPREQATERLEKRDFIGANEDDVVRRRMERLGAPPEATAGVGTRSFSAPEVAPAAGARAIIENVTLERILGSNDLMPIAFLALGLHRARSVGRIHIKDSRGNRLGHGTGFLVSPQLILTNNHVLETEQDAAGSEIEFDYELDLAGKTKRSVFFRLNPSAFFLTDRRLDFTLVAVQPDGGSARKPEDWGWNRLSETEGLLVKGEYVTIIQHPSGEPKQIALRENQVIDLLDDFAHYKTDTSPGSSGSPVFNDQWEIVALHHSGVPEPHPDGGYMSTDGRKWEQWMGEHKLKWIANEGVHVTRIAGFIKDQSSLTAAQKRLRDDLFNLESPLPTTIHLPDDGSSDQSAISLTARPRQSEQNPSAGHMTPGSSVASAAEISFTVPLQVSISLGSPLTPPASGAFGGPSTPIDRPQSVTPPTDNEGMQQALAELEQGRRRTYYDGGQDHRDRDEYYRDIDAENLSRRDFFEKLSRLLKSTHANQPKYAPSQHVYPWVDLHKDGMLRSIYSGKAYDPAEFIREDFRIEEERTQVLNGMLRAETFTAERMEQELNLLEARLPYNCEHVVPQSWYNKKEPMRGDLHHLFACESGCNSFRSNIAYFDFSDFEEAERTACGKRLSNKFEPVAGKGTVARATLYFLLRYPGKVDSPEEFPAERISTLLQWHHDHPPNEYERHRNQAIFEMQGNRNPLIDWPDWAGRVEFTLAIAT
ncbi:endonuclease [Stratiformator vulcanicus]|uniref:Serine protease n=1 Tax=Stratiformator vulcanicus TaxID=2527980 RepID=A0A517QWM7_9PLAN|nr:endonuclease [Stratiformator vulcanicus]QDT35968.1 Extracellular ribonuclease precursor [Stratiformator vulcanicus]